MDVIEKAIRGAFEKGDASDQAFREKVYRQAFAALDRVLEANPGVTVEAAMRRRKALQAKIVEIEQEYLPGRAPDVGEVDAVEEVVEIDPPASVPPPPVQPASQPAAEAQGVRPKAPPQRIEPTLEQSPEPPSHPMPQPPVRPEPLLADEPPVIERLERRAAETRLADAEPGPKRRRMGRIVRFFIAITLFAVLALGLWWAAQTGLLGSRQEPLPPVTTEQETEDFVPGADQPPVTASQPAPDRKWIPVFASGNITAVSAPADAKAEAMRDSTGEFVRITSGTSGSAILFDVGQGVLEQIAGKSVTFDIVARAQDGQETQISVSCNFGELGDCGRKRLTVGNARSDYLFDLQVPDKQPGARGTIAINSDFSNSGKSVDIFEIKVSVDE